MPDNTDGGAKQPDALDKNVANAFITEFHRFRRLEGVRYAHRLLTDLRAQCVAEMRDLGAEIADDMATLQGQFLRQRSEAGRAKQYANHYAAILRRISEMKLEDIGDAAALLSEVIEMAKDAGEWEPIGDA